MLKTFTLPAVQLSNCNLFKIVVLGIWLSDNCNVKDVCFSKTPVDRFISLRVFLLDEYFKKVWYKITTTKYNLYSCVWQILEFQGEGADKTAIIVQNK